MKIIVTENQSKILIENILLEKLGVNVDVSTLSKFLINYLEDKKYGQYELTKEQLPQLKNVNINKIIIDYNKTGKSYYLNNRKSQIINEGAILCFHFDGMNYNSIYHEINHALQFFVLGKERSKEQLTYIKAANISKTFAKNNKETIEYFSQLIYRSQEQEINSEVAGIYGQLSTEMEKMGWKKGNIQDIDKFKIVFETYIKNSTVYDNASFMINFNIFELFNPNKLVGSDNYDIRIFFTFMQDIIRKKPFYKGILDFFRIIWNYYSYNIRKTFNINILSEQQVNSLMKKYQIYINKQGEKLRRKLFRLYELFI